MFLALRFRQLPPIWMPSKRSPMRPPIPEVSSKVVNIKTWPTWAPRLSLPGLVWYIRYIGYIEYFHLLFMRIAERVERRQRRQRRSSIWFHARSVLLGVCLAGAHAFFQFCYLYLFIGCLSMGASRSELWLCNVAHLGGHNNNNSNQNNKNSNREREREVTATWIFALISTLSLLWAAIEQTTWTEIKDHRQHVFS